MAKCRVNIEDLENTDIMQIVNWYEIPALGGRQLGNLGAVFLDLPERDASWLGAEKQ
jgi:hypothetical protein